MLEKLLAISMCLLLTTLFGGCAGFEYSEPGTYGFYEPHYYYDRYPRYYHGPNPHNYVHAFRPSPGRDAHGPERQR